MKWLSSLFAQARLTDLDPGFFRDWLIVLAVLVGLVIGVLTLVEKLRAKKAADVVISPNPLRTQKVPDLATRAELEAIKRDIDDDLSELRGEMRAAVAKSHGEIVAIHNRINTVVENTGAMKGRLDEVAISLHELVRRSMK